MAIKKPIPITFNLDSHQSVQSVCAVIHIDDKNTETLDLSLLQGGEHIKTPLSSNVTARFVRVKDKILISDIVPCAVQENGNIHIPIDNAAAHMLVGEIKIEVNIVDENDILTMQFPLVIRVNNTILADAEITPESEGTIPELIEKAQETADNAQQVADNAQATASTAQQTADSAQTAANSAQQTADNAMAELGNKQDKLTAGENITIEDNVISAEGGGVTSYNDLTDKPRVADAHFNYFDIDKTFYFPDFDISLQGLLKQFSLKPLNSGKLENGDGYYVREAYKSTFNLNTPTLDMYGKWFYFDATNATGLPSGIDVVTTRYENQNKKIMMYSCRACQIYNGVANIDLPLLQEIYWTDSTLKNHYAIRTYIKKTDGTRLFTDWLELGSGSSQIVSGVVNANGTITFTDSEGNSFTTSGESVIGPQGAPGQDYVLTAQDKTDIANIVLGELPTTQGVLYGNQSN